MESSTISDYVELEKLKKSLPKKLINLAEKKKCKNIPQLGLAIKQYRDKTIQSHKPRCDGLNKHNSNRKTKGAKKLKDFSHSSSLSAEYAGKIVAKAKSLGII